MLSAPTGSGTEEGGVQRAISLESREELAARSVHAGKRSADHDPTILFRKKREHRSVHREGRIETRVEQTVRQQTDQVGSRDTIVGNEIAAHEHLAVTLQFDGVHDAVDAGADMKLTSIVPLVFRRIRPGC
jgi:hypothetical protein